MKKLHNNKLALGLTIGCSIVALATVGFSSWVINVSKGMDVSDISVEVADVVDKSVTITEAQLLSSNNSFAFGPQKGDTDGLIQNSGTTEDVEDLTFGITYKVNITDANQKSLQSITATIAVSTDPAGKAYTNAINSNYFVSPLSEEAATLAKATDGVPVNTGESGHAIYTTVEGDKSPYTCTTTFTYEWGTAFAGSNPAVYVDDTNAEDVKAALISLYKANGAKLTITLSPVV